ncbi:hypothetical protein ARMGADRAFT_543982 [Armillaria gallica]|uniref:Uncharacterized protein n=1 Tax=Armillaria gallica TaxID=47427 RepID=A0A2H3D9Q7_ARMGA|nr:hypothetical protein ARMGADRAFT_543982 [Armillaria gallica]
MDRLGYPFATYLDILIHSAISFICTTDVRFTSASATSLYGIPRSFQSLAKSHFWPFAPPSFEFSAIVTLHSPCQGLNHEISTSYIHLGVAQSAFEGRAWSFAGSGSCYGRNFTWARRPGGSFTYISRNSSHPTVSISPGRRKTESSMLRRLPVVLLSHQINAKASQTPASYILSASFCLLVVILFVPGDELFQMTFSDVYSPGTHISSLCRVSTK